MIQENIYIIAGIKFRLKKFEDYTHNEEVKIKELLGITDESETINLKSKDNNSLFPLLLEAVDTAVDISGFDFNNMQHKQTYEVMVDWIASRIFFTNNMPNYLTNLLGQKIMPLLNTKTNTAEQLNTHLQ